jgi:type I restriction enzyme M protein
MNQQIVEKYLWGAATALRGTIDAGDYKQYIFPLLFLKRICDVYDEDFEIADDSGHTAAEFYTNRTVVKLMTMIMDLGF